MTPSWAKKKTLKVVIILVLIWFLLFTALSAVMYLTWPKTDNTPEFIAQCEDAGWVRDEDTQECFEDTSDMVSDEELCNERWGTWYEENEVCIE